MKLKLLAIVCIMSSASAFAASRNYRKIDTSSDGSVTITGPAFQFNNDNYGLSSGSDLNGVCKLFGYPSAVANSMMTESPADENGDGENDEFAASIRISAAGTMAGLSNSSIIHSISCVTNEVAESSRAYRRISRSDDGTVVITEPYFNLGSESYGLASGSDKDGICALYGFGSYAEGTLTTASPDLDENGDAKVTNKVKINQDGKFGSLTSAEAAIYTIGCLPL